MFRRPLLPVTVFAAWTLFVWVQRVINVFGDDELSSGERLGALVRPVVFAAIGLSLVAVALRRVSGARARRIVEAGGWITLLQWVVQSVLIPARDYSVGFIVVHLVLGVVSSALALWAMRSVGVPPFAPVDLDSVDLNSVDPDEGLIEGHTTGSATAAESAGVVESVESVDRPV